MRVPNGGDSDPDLPEGWVRARRDDIAAINPGMDLANLPDDLEVSFVPMPAVEALSGRMVASAVRPLADVRNGYTRFNEGDVLFAKITPCMENGKIAIARNLRNRIGFGSTEFHVVRAAAGVSNDYLRLFLTQDSFRREAEHNFKGTAGQRRVPVDFLARSTVPLPPEAEQHRIVAKADELFSDLDAGVANLKRARALLEKYRQAVLKAAVTGELTREWREKRGAPAEAGAELLQRISKTRREAREGAKTRAKGKAPRNDRWKLEPKESATPFSSGDVAGYTVPDTWTTARFGQMFNVYVGSTPSRAERSYWNGSIPWVSSGEVAFRRIKSTRETITESGLAGSSTRLHPPGTVLLAMIGEGRTRGQAAILDIEACNNQNSAAIRVSEAGLPPEYIFYFLVRRYDETRRSSSGGNQPALNKDKVEDIAFPLPPHEEILEIIKRLDERLSNVDALNASLERQMKRSQALRQAILRHAFSGRLVPQDPLDEPASVLLERIRAERTVKPKPARGRARRAGAGGRQLELLG